MMKKTLLVLSTAFAVLFSQNAFACTGINFSAADGTYVSGRSVEWGTAKRESKLVIMPRGVKYQAYTSTGEKNGHKWTGKYGFVGISLVEDSYIGEGVNEAGLNAGMFYFAGFGSLTPYNKKHAAKSLVDMNFVMWLLSNFATVEEVKANLNKIIVVPVAYNKDGTPFPTAHWRVTDAKGGSIVIEIMNEGKINIHDNKIGVFTNSPDYPWHITNLSNYVDLRPGVAGGFQFNGVKVESLGGTSAMLGLPGDYTPPSRFVRAFFVLGTAPKAANAENAIKQGFQLLKGFTIPVGLEITPGTPYPDMPSATQWTAFSDLTNKIFYYNTMYNSAVRKIDLKKINFETVQQGTYPLDMQGEEQFQEILVK